MNLFITILFWAGVLLLADGSLGLIFEDKWQKLARGLNIRLLALCEVSFALLLLIVHYLIGAMS